MIREELSGIEVGEKNVLVSLAWWEVGLSISISLEVLIAGSSPPTADHP